MAKREVERNLNLFAPIEAEETTAPPTSSPQQETVKIKDPCPRCGSRSLRTVRAHEHGGNTNYCAAGCLSDDRTDAFYFTPKIEDLAAQERAKTIVENEVSEPEIREVETEVVGEGEQISLIDTGEKWEEHWRGMPEFVQNDLKPYKTIYVHFEKRKDMEAFAKLVEQRITLDTQSIWYPEDEGNDFSKMRYVDKATAKK